MNVLYYWQTGVQDGGMGCTLVTFVEEVDTGGGIDSGTLYN